MPLKYLHRRDLMKIMQEANIISNDVEDPSILVMFDRKTGRTVKVRRAKDVYEVIYDAVAVEDGQ